MSGEPKTIRVEVWPLDVDPHAGNTVSGIWLVSGADAWRTAVPLPADCPVFAEARLVLAGHGVREPAIVHGTSVREDRGGTVMITHVAVVPVTGAYVHDDWPDAQPVPVERLLGEVGHPIRVNPADEPLPRYLDVLFHAVRHLAFLAQWDSEARAAFPPGWLGQLERLTPALATLYLTEDAEATPIPRRVSA